MFQLAKAAQGPEIAGMTDLETETDGQVDGRRQRSERNRQKIIAAMFDLVRAGDMEPSAVRVAEHAQVGLRTVFRHFEDLDSIYREMAEQMEARILPQISKPLKAEDWQGRIKELMRRRIRVFEEIMPLRISASLRRYRSEFLMEGHMRFTQRERDIISYVLPEEISNDPVLLSAFDSTLSFATWRRMRQDQSMSRVKATRVVETMLDALIASI